MLFYFTEVSKYFITVFMLLYVLECIIYEFKNEVYSHSEGVVIRQRIYLVVIQILSYATLCLKLGSYDYLFLCLFVQIMMFAAMALGAMMYKRIDKVLLNNMSLLLSIGFIIVSRLDFNKAIKQFIIVTVSLAIGLFIPYIIKNIRNLSRFGYIYAACGIVPLLVVLILGTATHGSKISYTIAGITFQPSEFVKIIFVFCVASLLGKAKTFADIMLATSIAASHVLILVFSKDLGSGLVFFVAYIFMLFIATKNYLYLGLGFAGGIAASIVAYNLFSHVRVRVMAYRDPFATIDNQGYQISQSLFAIGYGNFFGTGLAKGVSRDIPFVESDFIFSAIAEEMGAIFAVSLLLVCFSSFVIMMRAGMRKTKKFNRLLAVGLAVIYIFQVFLTVGGGIKFIPLTGVTLPFVSYGGSSVLTSVILFLVVQSVIIAERDEDYENYLKMREMYDDEET